MMKRLVVLVAIIVSSLSMNAQEFNASISGAVPTEDVSDFGLNLDVNLLWETSEQFDLGVTAGYDFYFTKNINSGPLDTDQTDDFGFLPVAAAGRFNLNESFTLGADVGYAIGTNNGTDGGFYYAPKAQYGITPALDLVLAYKGISAGNGSFDAVSLGIEFGF